MGGTLITSAQSKCLALNGWLVLMTVICNWAVPLVPVALLVPFAVHSCILNSIVLHAWLVMPTVKRNRRCSQYPLHPLRHLLSILALLVPCAVWVVGHRDRDTQSSGTLGTRCIPSALPNLSVA